MTDPRSRPVTLCTVLAAVAYLIVAVVTFRTVLGAPATSLPYPILLEEDATPERSHAFLDHWDQEMVLGTTIRNAHLLVTRPWDLFGDEGQCYPMPNAYTLGEHMFGLGLLATIPYVLVGDPILTFNLTLVLTVWIPALTMYFFALRLTRSPAAAFVAGLAFALVPNRIVDPSHPYVHGDLWAPAALLFLHRCFVSSRWRDGLLLGLFLSLEVLESFYSLLATLILGTVYGLYLLFRHRAALPRALPLLLVAAAMTVATAWVVLFPYLDTQAVWGLLSGRLSILLRVREFMPGHYNFVGWVVLALVLVAIADRFRGPRLVHGEDPRLAFLIGGFVVLWCAIGRVPLPLTDAELPSPFWILRQILPGFAAVRALAAVSQGLHLASAFLAGYGALALITRFRLQPRAAALVVAGLCLSIMAFRFVTPLAELSFGRTLRLASWTARPPDEEIELLRALPDGPLVDIPLRFRTRTERRLDVADHLLRASFDPRPQALCYNSFASPVNIYVADLAEALPDAGAADALAALGFQSVLFHKTRMSEEQRSGFFRDLQSNPESLVRLRPLGKTDSTVAYSLASPAEVSEDLSLLQLVPGGPASGGIEVPPPSAEISFRVTNRGDVTFRHPEPLLPSPAIVRWRSTDGRIVRSDATRVMLPVALGAKGSTTVTVQTPVPEEPGHYVVTLTPGSESGAPIALQSVRVVPLETTMTRAEVLLRRNRPVLRERSLDLPVATLDTPDVDLAMILVPGVSASEIASQGDLMLQWIAARERKVATTPAFGAGKTPPEGKTTEVRTRIPDLNGALVVLLSPADDLDRVLAIRLVMIESSDAPDAKP